MNLKEWLPKEALNENEYPKLTKLLDSKVIKQYGGENESKEFPKASKFRNVHNWCVVNIKNRYYAVGWNESPRSGWSFPTKWLKDYDQPSLPLEGQPITELDAFFA